MPLEIGDADINFATRDRAPAARLEPSSASRSTISR